MAITFDDVLFDINDYEEHDDYAPIPQGDYRIRVEAVEPKIAKSGNRMFEFTFAVSGDNRKLWYYLVLTQDKKVTNQKLGSFFKSFGITDFNLNNWASWQGKVGACRIKHEEDTYNGGQRAVLHYFIDGARKDKLPPWKEPANGTMQNASETSGTSGMMAITNDTPW